MSSPLNEYLFFARNMYLAIFHESVSLADGNCHRFLLAVLTDTHVISRRQHVHVSDGLAAIVHSRVRRACYEETSNVLLYFSSQLEHSQVEM